METLPFHEMHPRNDLVTAGEAFCLAKPGAAYALYLPRGGSVTVELAGSTRYQSEWWNPANDMHGECQSGGSVQGGRQTFAAPCDDDWALRIVADRESK